jgi:hypothetical protein
MEKGNNMFIIAIAIISGGYSLVYWGANNIKAWNKSLQTTDAAPLSILIGVGNAEDLAKADKFPIHPIPFPYDSNRYGGTSGTPSTSSSPSAPAPTGPSGGASINPNFPGNGSQPMPNPGIPV